MRLTLFPAAFLLLRSHALVAPRARLVATRLSMADDAPFVENPFHAKPGFGGADALRCICQNPDDPLFPDGHGDDDAAAAPPRPRRRVILFDVLDTLVVDPFFRGMHAAVFGCDSLEDLYAAADPAAYEAFELGAIDEATLWRTYFRDGTRAPPDGAAARRFLRENYDWVRGMRSLLGEIRRVGDVEVYALSNYGPLYALIEEALGLSRFLDWRFVSCDTGVRKPAAAAFDGAVASLGVDPAFDAVCFVDDSRANCAAAEAAGLAAIHFTGDSADCRTGLIAAGFVELRV